jgi:hypothetical protein
MILDRRTIAKIRRIAVGFPEDEEAMLKYAEEKTPYFYDDGFCIFVIARGDKILPLERFVDRNTKHITIVLSYDAVTLGILPALWLVEIAKQRGNEGNLHVEIVGDIGKDAFTGEVRYGYIRYPSNIDLLKEIDTHVRTEKTPHLQKLQKDYNWTTLPGGVSRLTHAYIRGALRHKLATSPNAIVSLGKDSGGRVYG